MKAPGSRWMYLTERVDEFDPRAVCLPAARSPFIPAFVLQRRYLSIPSVPGTFPHSCNDPASVSLNHNIWNGVIMNSRPHSSVPSPARTYKPPPNINSPPLPPLSPSPSGFFLSSQKDKGLKITIWWLEWHSQIWSILMACSFPPQLINESFVILSSCLSAHSIYASRLVTYLASKIRFFFLKLREVIQLHNYVSLDSGNL